MSISFISDVIYDIVEILDRLKSVRRSSMYTYLTIYVYLLDRLSVLPCKRQCILDAKRLQQMLKCNPGTFPCHSHTGPWKIKVWKHGITGFLPASVADVVLDSADNADILDMWRVLVSVVDGELSLCGTAYLAKFAFRVFCKFLCRKACILGSLLHHCRFYIIQAGEFILHATRAIFARHQGYAHFHHLGLLLHDVAHLLNLVAADCYYACGNIAVGEFIL